MSSAPDGSTDINVLPRAAPPSGFPVRPTGSDPPAEDMPPPDFNITPRTDNPGTTSSSPHRSPSLGGGGPPMPNSVSVSGDPDVSRLAAAFGGATRPIRPDPPYMAPNPYTSGVPVNGTNSESNGASPQGSHSQLSAAFTPGTTANFRAHDLNQPVEPTGDPQRRSMEFDLRRILFVVEHRKTLVLHLRNMLRDAKLPLDGVKRVKIDRLIDHARQLVLRNRAADLHKLRRIVDVEAPNELRPPVALERGLADGDSYGALPEGYEGIEAVLRNHGVGEFGAQAGAAPANTGNYPYGHANRSSGNAQAYSAMMRANTAARNARRPGSVGDSLVSSANNPLSPPTLLFRASPFYTLGLPLRPPVFFTKPYTRRKVHDQLVFTLDAHALSKTANHVFLVAQELKRDAKGPQPVYFPFYNELEFDGHVLNVNTRGVRGFPGSAKPVDLRPYLLDPAKISKENGQAPESKQQAPPSGLRKHVLRISMTISDQVDKMSDQSFGFALYYGVLHSEEELMQTLTGRPHISKEETQQLAAANAASIDDDILASDAVLSLKDKVMMTRIKVPIRSRECSHIDCFDAQTFLMLQDQAETWKCPVCNNQISWDKLAVDDFFTEILDRAGPDADTVVINADGTWTIEEESGGGDTDDSDSEDDWFAKRELKRKMGTVGSQSHSANGAANGSAGHRQETEVVSLLSDTEDEADAPNQNTPATRSTGNQGQNQNSQMTQVAANDRSSSTSHPEMSTAPQLITQSSTNQQPPADQRSLQRANHHVPDPENAINDFLSAFQGARSALFDAAQGENMHSALTNAMYYPAVTPPHREHRIVPKIPDGSRQPSQPSGQVAGNDVIDLTMDD